MISGRHAPRLKSPQTEALAVASAETAFSRAPACEPQIPVEGVRIARHRMFVDCSKAQRELGFQPGSVEAALERAVRWYESNGYVAARGSKPLAQAHAA